MFQVDGINRARIEERREESQTETDGRDRRVTGVPSTPRRIETFGHLYKDENSGGLSIRREPTFSRSI